jgi:hypothetical protein
MARPPKGRPELFKFRSEIYLGAGAVGDGRLNREMWAKLGDHSIIDGLYCNTENAQK